MQKHVFYINETVICTILYWRDSGFTKSEIHEYGKKIEGCAKNIDADQYKINTKVVVANFGLKKKEFVFDLNSVHFSNVNNKDFISFSVNGNEWKKVCYEIDGLKNEVESEVQTLDQAYNNSID